MANEFTDIVDYVELEILEIIGDPATAEAAGQAIATAMRSIAYMLGLPDEVFGSLYPEPDWHEHDWL